MTDDVKIIECPRDAWQGLPQVIPTEVKVLYLAALIEAGFRRLDAVSFVSARAVPQMADSEEVLRRLDPPGDVEITGIVMNRKGAERAIEAGAVRWLGFPYSVSTTFAMRNQRQTPEQSLQELTAIRQLAEAAGIRTVVYLSMAFGNPYQDPWSPQEVVRALREVEGLGVDAISLADTVGVARPEDVAELLGLAKQEFPRLDIGVHLHSRPETALLKFAAA
jgi:hydroxymethylglutaryl-CoA lyase